jgi:hypothetical protein
LKNIRHGNPLAFDHSTEHSFPILGDSDVGVRLSFRIFDREVKLPITHGSRDMAMSRTRLPDDMITKAIQAEFVAAHPVHLEIPAPRHQIKVLRRSR